MPAIPSSNYPYIAYPEWWGAKGNGTSNDTVAMLRACQNGRVRLARGKTYLVDEAVFSNGATIDGDFSTIKINTEGATPNDGVITTSAPLHINNLVIDFNGKGKTGIRLNAGADGSRITNLFGHSFTGTDIGGTGENRSLILIDNANNCTLTNIRGKDMLKGTATNGSAGRLVSVIGGASGTVVNGISGENVQDIVVLASSTNTHIHGLTGNGIIDNGLYILTSASKVVVDDFFLYNGADEAFVVEGTDITIRNGKIVNYGLIGLQDAHDILMENIHLSYDASYIGAGLSFMRTRSGNTLSSNITIRNIKSDFKHYYAVLNLGTGTVNGLTVENSYFKTHWHAMSDAKKFTVHTTGDTITYRDNTFEVVDDTASLTTADKFSFEIPTVTGASEWKSNKLLVSGGAHELRVTNPIQDLITYEGAILEDRPSVGPYIRDTSYIGGTTGRGSSIRIFYGSMAPVNGTYLLGDRVINIDSDAGEYAEWVCTVSGTPGTWVDVGYVATVISGTYLPVLSNVTNIAASTAYTAQYMRVGSVVTVSGRVAVDPTTTGQTQLGMTLPVASNFANARQLGGTAFTHEVAGMGAAIYSDLTNDRAQMEWIAVDTGNRDMQYTYTYVIQ